MLLDGNNNPINANMSFEELKALVKQGLKKIVDMKPVREPNAKTQEKHQFLLESLQKVVVNFQEMVDEAKQVVSQAVAGYQERPTGGPPKREAFGSIDALGAIKNDRPEAEKPSPLDKLNVKLAQQTFKMEKVATKSGLKADKDLKHLTYEATTKGTLYTRDDAMLAVLSEIPRCLKQSEYIFN
jgi:hypothetical protein